MKTFFCAASVLSLCAGAASAAGLDRSNQSISPIFNAPGTGGLSFGYVEPSITGKDAAGNSYDVGGSYTQSSVFWTEEITEAFSYSVIVDQPYGADIDYNNDPSTSAVGGTLADLDSQAMTLVGRYKANANLSFHAGLSVQRITAEVLLNGQAYAAAISSVAVADGFNANLPPGAPQLSPGDLASATIVGDPAAQAAFVATYAPILGGVSQAMDALQSLGTSLQGTAGTFLAQDGYSFDMDESIRVQPLIGVAYEIPDIALRFAATYYFETQHGADTEEELFGLEFDGDVEFVAPQALNIDFQTGIATDTLLTASYRWAQYSAVDIVPDRLASDLVNLDDGRRWTLGVARRFTDEWAGSITLLYEPEGEDELVSPLGPTNGLLGVTIGARYESGGLIASAGFNYSELGDARATVAGNEVVDFENNSSRAFGFQLSYEF